MSIYDVYYESSSKVVLLWHEFKNSFYHFPIFQKPGERDSLVKANKDGKSDYLSQLDKEKNLWADPDVYAEVCAKITKDVRDSVLTTKL